MVTNCGTINTWEGAIVTVTTLLDRVMDEIVMVTSTSAVALTTGAASGASKPNESIVVNLAPRPFCLRCPFISNVWFNWDVRIQGPVSELSPVPAGSTYLFKRAVAVYADISNEYIFPDGPKSAKTTSRPLRSRAAVNLPTLCPDVTG